MDADPVKVSSPRARPRVRSGRKRGPASSRGWIRPSLSSPRAPASSWRSPPAPPPLVLVGRGRRPRLPVAPRVSLPRPSRSQPQAQPKPARPSRPLSTEPGKEPNVSSPPPAPLSCTLFGLGRFGPESIFFRLCDFAFYPVIYQFCRKTLEPHACNNYLTVHQIKIIYICKMLRKLCRLIICHFPLC